LLQHANEGRGRFRTFLLTSLNNFAIGQFRKKSRSISDATVALPHAIGDATPPPQSVVEAQWAKSLIHAVLAGMRDECERTDRMDVWLVFEARILAELFEDRPPVSYQQLADELRLSSPTQAANLLVTAKRMYTRLLRSAVSEYESANADIDAEIADLHRALSGLNGR